MLPIFRRKSRDIPCLIEYCNILLCNMVVILTSMDKTTRVIIQTIVVRWFFAVPCCMLCCIKWITSEYDPKV